MIHYMKLSGEPFDKTAEGKKKIELRLFDEKRKKISVGDMLVFRNNENLDLITATVKALHTFPDFTELYKSLPLTLCGSAEGEEAEPSDMERYYTKEDINKYGAVGIELCDITAVRDVKSRLTQPPFFNLLAPSVYDPTEERLQNRAGRYKGDENTQVYAISRDGSYKGIVAFSSGKQAVIHDIAVDPSCRKEGMGKTLIEFIFRLGAETVTAETDDDAVGFYKKCGFTVTETESDYETKRYLCERRRTWEER